MNDLIVSDLVVDDNNSPITTSENNSIINSEDKMKLFSSLITICNEEHLSYCDCQAKRIKEEADKIIVNELKELEDKNQLHNIELINERIEYANRLALKRVGHYCEKNRITCPIEEEKIKQNLEYFNKAYDLTDPRVYIIVDSLLHQMLSAHRMHMHSNTKGILNIHYDKLGNKSYSLNPVEEVKRRFNETLVRGIETLNKIIEGEKHFNVNVNLQDRVFKRKDLGYSDE